MNSFFVYEKATGHYLGYLWATCISEARELVSQDLQQKQNKSKYASPHGVTVRYHL